MKIIVEFDEQEFMQFMGWKNSLSSTREQSGLDQTPIGESPLTLHTRRVLIESGLKTIAEAQVMTDAELFKFPTVGRKAIREFRELYPMVRATHPKD